MILNKLQKFLAVARQLLKLLTLKLIILSDILNNREGGIMDSVDIIVFIVPFNIFTIR